MDEELFRKEFVTDYFTIDDYLDIWLEHLNEFEITNIKWKMEVDFVTLILERSLKLKKVQILVYDKDDYLRISKQILRSPRASSDLDILVGYSETNKF